MRRGEIRLVDFNPARGSEASKIRPAVVVSNDDSNRAVERVGRGVVTVVPLTSNVSRIYPYQVLVPAPETGSRDCSVSAAPAAGGPVVVDPDAGTAPLTVGASVGLEAAALRGGL